MKRVIDRGNTLRGGVTVHRTLQESGQLLRVFSDKVRPQLWPTLVRTGSYLHYRVPVFDKI